METTLHRQLKALYAGPDARLEERIADFRIDAVCGPRPVEDQRLLAVTGVHQFQAAADLLSLLPADLPDPFHSGHVADGLGIRRWIAQRIVYCLRQTGAAETCGKSGNTLLYKKVA